MKEKERKRIHVYITDENYKRIAVTAAEEGKDKWEVVDKALREYFAKEGDR
jgi:hypothetical protein